MILNPPLRRLRQLTLLPAALLLAMAASAAEGIHVNGRGVVETVPDMATVHLQVRREGEDPAELKEDIDRVVERIIAIATSLDIEQEEVTAAYINIQPRYRRSSSSQVTDGVIASRAVAVVVRDLSKVMRLIGRSLDAGANTIDHLQLDSSRRLTLEREALDLAMADAQETAARVAAGFGVERGAVLNVITYARMVAPERRFDQEIFAMSARAGGQGDAPFEPGLLRIEQTIDATFAISPVAD